MIKRFYFAWFIVFITLLGSAFTLGKAATDCPEHLLYGDSVQLAHWWYPPDYRFPIIIPAGFVLDFNYPNFDNKSIEYDNNILSWVSASSEPPLFSLKQRIFSSAGAHRSIEQIPNKQNVIFCLYQAEKTPHSKIVIAAPTDLSEANLDRSHEWLMGEPKSRSDKYEADEII